MDRTHPADQRSLLAALVSSRRSLAALALVASLASIPNVADAILPQVSPCAPPGWSAPAVPRNTGDADSLSAIISTELVGGAGTYINWASCGNIAARGGWTDQLSLDDTVIESIVRPFDHLRATNQGPLLIRGGRHTLKVNADAFHTSGESVGSQGDNVWYGQWVWSPLSADWAWTHPFYFVQTPPPSRGPSVNPNSDGYTLTRLNSATWCVAIASPGNNDLLVYDDYADATHGFSHALATSACGSDSIDLVVGQGAGTPMTVYPGITSGLTGTPNYFALSASEASQRSGNASSSWGVTHLSGYQSADVYSLHLEAGQPMAMTVSRTLGSVPLVAALFPGGSGTVSSRNQALVTASVGSSPGTITFTAPTTDDYPLVVFRDTSTGIDTDVYYMVNPSQPLAVSDAGASLALLGATPNPLRHASRIDYSTPSAGHVTLAVHDVQGRRVRTLVDASVPAGPHAVSWDARDDAGRQLPAGEYWMRLVTAEGTRTRAVVVAR
jgi:hypothetical protein